VTRFGNPPVVSHARYPESICSHRTGAGSIASYWMDLQDGIFHVANGLPCQTSATRIPVEDLGTGFSRRQPMRVPS